MTIDKKYVDQIINVTSKAAIASSFLVGKKDKIASDQAAVDSMRKELNKINKTTFLPAKNTSIDIEAINLPERESYKYIFVNGYFNEELSDVLTTDFFEVKSLTNAINENHKALESVLFH